MRTLIKTIILMQCVTLFSCDMFSGKIMVGRLDKVINGTYQIQIELKPNMAGWNIHIGDPFGDDFKKNIIEKNKSIMNKRLTLNIINDSKFDMWIFTHPGEGQITSKSSITYFDGTLEDLISNKYPITLSRTDGKEYSFTIEFRFEGKDIEIKSPIPIVAEWHDAL